MLIALGVVALVNRWKFASAQAFKPSLQCCSGLGGAVDGQSWLSPAPTESEPLAAFDGALSSSNVV